MKKYVLITPDGFTQDMEGADVENCQVLGCAEGRDFGEAFKKFNRENAWFSGFKFENIKGYEVMSFEEVG